MCCVLYFFFRFKIPYPYFCMKYFPKWLKQRNISQNLRTQKVTIVFVWPDWWIWKLKKIIIYVAFNLSETMTYCKTAVPPVPALNHQHNEVQLQWVTHNSDVIMGAMASLIISLTIVYSTVIQAQIKNKNRSSASLAFVRVIHRWPVNTPLEGQ